MFKGICPTHGEVWGGMIGNHSTYSESRTKRKFPKKVRSKIRSSLNGEEQQRFNDALYGWYLPTKEDMERWTKIVTTESENA